jgi:CheY-like chemotaxis protein
VVTRVLLVEDNEASIQVIGEYLEAHGYRVTVGRNGLEGLERAEALRPDLILMDIQMPQMDGLKAIGILRTRPASAATPIVALTALAMPGDRERCLAAGANAYLTKPVALKSLVATIERLLNGRAEGV